ncbi:4-alpha-glucanotransferase [Hoylesella oralis]|uniref:4-alpha-glucanotransferase n=1 Tax=Hoylesella oralis TaxID=28134 RepID=UPI0028F0D696|nr:4-alpha-glucanotransferase [Hoylesella oralis]
MKIIFNIDYKTVFGEELVLNILGTDRKGTVKASQFRMSTLDGSHWTYQMNKAQSQLPEVMDYFYSVDCSGHEQRHEWSAEAHRLEINVLKGLQYRVYDRWIDIPEDAYLYSSAFTDCLSGRSVKPVEKCGYGKTVRLKVRAPQLLGDCCMAVSGSCKALGAWNAQEAVRMTEHNYHEWVVDLNADDFEDNKVEFKFVAVDARYGSADPTWETGLNRTVTLPEMREGDVVVYELSQAFLPIYNRKVAGTLVPVFSLRSKSSFGVGDFGDLKLMIDFVAMTGQRVLQVLPLNDTTTTHTWTDSYPYSCISIFALHPQYVDLRQLPLLEDEVERKRYMALQKELNGLPKVDYERVNNAKTAYLKKIYEQSGKAIVASSGYKKFFKEAEQWLVPYAQYCYLRDLHGTVDFSEWKGHETWNEAERKMLSSPKNKAYKELEFYYYVQYVLNEQLEAVHAYAKSKHVILKGDIPIGVNRRGCDVWMEPKYFCLDSQAGAPPDNFSVNGQNWGFPTYNWDAMLQDDCRWWVRRFRYMAKYFDAYRIDHVLGFFRIWDIPIDCVNGLMGQFSPSLGMTREEIEAYGLHFQEELFTRPFIADWVVDRMFREYADEVREKYLEKAHDDIYNLKPEYDTQRKIEAVFIGKTTDKDTMLRDGLYALASNVLFVRDRKDTNKFHPRITAQFNLMYEALYDSDKDTFNRIYNDYYYRRNNQFWYREAMKKLPKLVQSTRMLVCAEDLGMVPDCVAWVMDELRILGLEVQSMPKSPEVRFAHLAQNPYRSVDTISSHDMPTLRQWWDEDRERTQEYYNTMLQRQGAAPHPLPGWLARDIISRHLASPSMLCVLSIQDWMAVDEQLRLADKDAERINVPANPCYYWRYRMHVNIEELMQNDDFRENIKQLIAESDRK